MTNKTNFFDRMMEQARKNGYSTVKELSIALGYKSTEKLYRLDRDPSNKPSFTILEDLANLFDSIDLNYLVTGESKNYGESKLETLQVREEDELYDKLEKFKALFGDNNYDVNKKLDTLIEMMGQGLADVTDKVDKLALIHLAENEIQKEKKQS